MTKKISSSPLSYALIGCGRVSIKHLKAILAPDSGLKLTAIVDSNPEAPRRLLKDMGLSDKACQKILAQVRLYEDYQSMLLAEKPQVVAITVPSGLHYAIALSCLQAGCHLLLEKPMTMKLSEARELYELAEKNGCKIAMGHIYRYFPIVQNLQKDLAKGKFGVISHGSVTVRWGHDQAYYNQAAWRGTWKSDGGVLMNQTIHALDLLCWLMNGTATAASAMLAQRNHTMEAEDVALGLLRLDSGALCQIEGTTNTSPRGHEAAFFIVGSKGSIRVGIKKGRPFFDIRGENYKGRNFYYFRKEFTSKGLRGIFKLFNPHAGIYEDLVSSIQENKQPIANAFSGYQSVEMVLGLYRSALERKEIPLPATEDFTTLEMSNFFEKQGK